MRKINVLILSLLVMASCGDKEKAYDATGTFETEEVTVSAKSSGELVLFNLNEGQLVGMGDVVGNIESDMLQLQRSQLDTQLSQFDADEAGLQTTQRQMDANSSQLDATRSQMDASIQQLEAGKRKVDYTEAATASGKLDLEKQLAVIKQQIANQERELQRFTELYNDGAVARKQVDDIKNNISVLEKQLVATEDQIRSANNSIDNQINAIRTDAESADAQIEGVVAQQRGVDAQKAGVEAQKAEVDTRRRALQAQRENVGVQQAQIDRQIENTMVSSPISGTVLEKYVQQGEYMTPGKPMFKVADTGNMILRAYVTSAQLQNVKVGQKVTVMTDYGNNSGKTYNGVVTWISPNAEFTPKTIVTEDERADLVYAIKIAVKNDGGIKIGMYGKVKF